VLQDADDLGERLRGDLVVLAPTSCCSSAGGVLDAKGSSTMR
jgi:hypothetical protein